MSMGSVVLRITKGVLHCCQYFKENFKNNAKFAQMCPIFFSTTVVHKMAKVSVNTGYIHISVLYVVEAF